MTVIDIVDDVVEIHQVWQGRERRHAHRVFVSPGRAAMIRRHDRSGQIITDRELTEPTWLGMAVGLDWHEDTRLIAGQVRFEA